MSNVLMLLHNNFIPSAALTGGVWLAPLSEMQDPRPRRKSRSSGLSLANTQFKIDFGAAKAFLAMALTNTNLTSAALYRITWFSDAFTTAIDNTGWLPIAGYPTEDPDDIGAALVHIFPAAVSARYWKVDIDDHTNVDGYVEIGVGFAGEAWQPPFNYSADNNNDGYEANTPIQKSLGGTPYFIRRTPARVFSFGWQFLDTDTANEVRRIRKIANLNKQVFVIPDPDDPADFNRGAFLGTLREMPTIQRLAAGLNSTGFTIAEYV